jgi:hypothetical protein
VSVITTSRFATSSEEEISERRRQVYRKPDPY